MAVTPSSASSSVFIKLPDHLDKAVNAGDAAVMFDAATQAIVVTLGDERWSSPVVECAPSSLPQGLTLQRESTQVAVAVPKKHAVDFALVVPAAEAEKEPVAKAAPRAEAEATPTAATGGSTGDSDSSKAAVVAALEALFQGDRAELGLDAVMGPLSTRFTRAAVTEALRETCVRTRDGGVTLRRFQQQQQQQQQQPQPAKRPTRTWGGKEVADDFHDAAAAIDSDDDGVEAEDEASKRERLQREADAAEQRREAAAAMAAAEARKKAAEEAAASAPPVTSLAHVPLAAGFDVHTFGSQVEEAVKMCESVIEQWRADSGLEHPSDLGPKATTRALLTVAQFRATSEVFDTVVAAAAAGAALVTALDHAAADGAEWLTTSQSQRSPESVRVALEEFLATQRASLQRSAVPVFATTALAAQQLHARLASFRDMVSAGVISIS